MAGPEPFFPLVWVLHIKANTSSILQFWYKKIRERVRSYFGKLVDSHIAYILMLRWALLVAGADTKLSSSRDYQSGEGRTIWGILCRCNNTYDIIALMFIWRRKNFPRASIPGWGKRTYRSGTGHWQLNNMIIALWVWRIKNTNW